MAVVGYSVKCKAKKEMVDPQEGVTKNGRVITKGTCPDCGTKMSLIGGVAKKQLFKRIIRNATLQESFLPIFLAYTLCVSLVPLNAGLFLFISLHELHHNNLQQEGNKT